jgi:hypothetical protein
MWAAGYPHNAWRIAWFHGPFVIVEVWSEGRSCRVEVGPHSQVGRVTLIVKQRVCQLRPAFRKSVVWSRLHVRLMVAAENKFPSDIIPIKMVTLGN